MVGNAIFGLPHSVCPEPVAQGVLDTAKVGGKVGGFLHVRIGPELQAAGFFFRFLTPTDDDDWGLLIRRQAV